MPESNFGHAGLAPVGQYRRVGPFGTADMAVIALRRILIREAKNIVKGEEPIAPHNGALYRNRRCGSIGTAST